MIKNIQQKLRKKIIALYDYEKNVEDMALPIAEQVSYETELLGTPMSIYDMARGTSFIVELDIKNSPKATVYGLSTGVLTEVKVRKAHFKKQPFEQGNIVQFMKLKKKPKVSYAGKDEKGKPKFEPIDGEYDVWCLDENDDKAICYRLIKI